MLKYILFVAISATLRAPSTHHLPCLPPHYPACDADDEPSVDSCDACTGDGYMGCTSGTCSAGFHTYVSGSKCTGQAALQLTHLYRRTQCISFVNLLSSSPPTVCDANDEPSLASCEACESGGSEGCTNGTCAVGFHTFFKGTLMTGCTGKAALQLTRLYRRIFCPTLTLCLFLCVATLRGQSTHNLPCLPPPLPSL